MTNEDRIKELSGRKLAFFLMNYSDSCRCCIYKKTREDGFFDYMHKCTRPEGCEDYCIDGYVKWLQREEPTKDDDFMFRACTHNVLVEEYERLSDDMSWRDWKLVRKDGLVVAIERIKEEDLDYPF